MQQHRHARCVRRPATPAALRVVLHALIDPSVCVTILPELNPLRLYLLSNGF